jgi:micrococcal nuclease
MNCSRTVSTRIVARGVALITALTSMNFVVAKPVFAEEAKVVKVISGDTFIATIGGNQFTIGLIGLDAPKPGQSSIREACHGNASRAALTRLIGKKTIRIERDQTDFDASGRLMRNVLLPDGRNATTMQLSIGAARYTASNADARYAQDYATAEATARTKRVGLWKVCEPAVAQSPSVVATPPSQPAATGECTAFRLLWVQEKQRDVPEIAALQKTPPGSCAQDESGQYTWQPAGSIHNANRSFIAIWKDNVVCVKRADDGSWIHFVLFLPADKRNSEMKDTLLSVQGDRGQFLTMFNGTQLIEFLPDGRSRSLVDVLQFDSGRFRYCLSGRQTV